MATHRGESRRESNAFCQAGSLSLRRYLLRSFGAFGLDRYVRTVFVVHSDHHAPPAYLRSSERLRFVPHSALIPASDLPTTDRQHQAPEPTPF